MLRLITVKILLINEDWQMPLYLKESLYKCIFEDPHSVTKETYKTWFDSLTEEDQQKIRKTTIGVI